MRTWAFAVLALAGVCGVAGEARAGGARIETDRGAIHTWWPDDRELGGTVVYIHGYWTSLDDAWQDDALVTQFEASRLDALFVAPEAPSGPRDGRAFGSLDEVLDAVADQLGFTPPGPIVLVGHSGAIYTVDAWLDDPAITHVILLDAGYGDGTAVRHWITHRSGGRLTVVAASTVRKSRRLVARLGAHQLSAIPHRLRELDRDDRAARVLYLESQFDHDQIVSSGEVIPVLLRRTRLPRREPAEAGPGRPATR